MAERRMFAKQIIDSDAFLDMPLSTQALYFHLSMRGDDEGFINNPKKILRMVGGSEDDLKLLISKNFIITFESGIIVIKHWRMHNYIRGDRKKDTVYQDELNLLEVKGSGAYTVRSDLNVIECQPNDNQMTTKRQTSDGQVTVKCQPNVSIGKVRLGKVSIDKDSIDNTPAKKVKHKYGEYNNVLLTNDEMEKLKAEYSDIDSKIENLSSYVASTGKSYKSHYATIRNWARKEKPESIKHKVDIPKFTQAEIDNMNDFERMKYGIN